jgi:hypothetical protein
LCNRKRNSQKHCQEESRKECRKKGARTPNGSCHMYGQGGNRTIPEKRKIRENERYPNPDQDTNPVATNLGGA